MEGCREAYLLRVNGQPLVASQGKSCKVKQGERSRDAVGLSSSAMKIYNAGSHLPAFSLFECIGGGSSHFEE
jgi:hypothetical protein